MTSASVCDMYNICTNISVHPACFTMLQDVSCWNDNADIGRLRIAAQTQVRSATMKYPKAR